MSIAMRRAASGIRDDVLSHLLDVLEHTRVDDAPFQHLYLEGAFPPEIYAAMLEHRPRFAQYRPADGKQQVTRRYAIGLDEANLARLSGLERDLWGGIGDALASDALKAKFFDLFASDLCRRFRTGRTGLDRIAIYPKPALVCDLGGYSIAPHPDTRAKVVTAQFYLARDASQLELGTALYRRRVFNPRNLISLENLFQKIKQFEFRPNTGYAFPVGRKSWHGRHEVPATAGDRHSLLLFYYRDPSRGW